MKKHLNLESAANVSLEIDPSGITPAGDSIKSLAGGYNGPILVQNASGAAFDPKSKETRLGMGFQITPQDYNAAKNIAKQYGVDLDNTDKPWQSLNKARQNERLQMVKQKGIEMGLINPDSGVEELSFSQNANPQTVLDSPLNKWLWDAIRSPDVAFSKKNQEVEPVQEDTFASVEGQQQAPAVAKQKGKKPPPNFSTAMGFKVDPGTERKIKSTIKQAGVKPSGNVYKDMVAAQNRINIVSAMRRSMKGL